VVDGPAFAEVRTAIKKKYGWQYSLIDLLGTVRGRFTKDTAADCGVVLHIQH
jgi:hypothetical protein